MRGKTAAILLAALFALAGAPSAFADQPPGQLGYEGQPGNQGGGGHNGAVSLRASSATKASPAIRAATKRA